MARARELRCPGCGEVLPQSRRVRATVGPPFEECSKCHALVSRPFTNEWDLLGPGRKALCIVDRVAPFVVLGLVPGLAYWAFAFREGRDDPNLLLALLCAGPVLVALLPLSAALRAIRRSRARMADPMYRARLIEFGRRAPAAARP